MCVDSALACFTPQAQGRVVNATAGKQSAVANTVVPGFTDLDVGNRAPDGTINLAPSDSIKCLPGQQMVSNFQT